MDKEAYIYATYSQKATRKRKNVVEGKERESKRGKILATKELGRRA